MPSLIVVSQINLSIYKDMVENTCTYETSGKESKSLGLHLKVMYPCLLKSGESLFPHTLRQFKFSDEINTYLMIEIVVFGFDKTPTKEEKDMLQQLDVTPEGGRLISLRALTINNIPAKECIFSKVDEKGLNTINTTFGFYFKDKLIGINYIYSNLGSYEKVNAEYGLIKSKIERLLYMTEISNN